MTTKRKGVAPSVFVGFSNKNKQGDLYRVVEYNGSRDVTVLFESTNTFIKSEAKEVKNGSIKNPLSKSAYGVGCFGVGKFKAKIGQKFTQEYQTWIGMIGRVYSEKELAKHPLYERITVCDFFLNYQNFAGWCQSQVGFKVKDVNGRHFYIDKDLLIPNNSVYSPEACCFIPCAINSALKGRQYNKQDQTPSGVYWHKASNSFIASLGKFDKQAHLGCFGSIAAAEAEYTKEKESYVRELAELYKCKISEKAYKALLEFSLSDRDGFRGSYLNKDGIYLRKA